MEGQAATACRRCREHKQRCSREQPECGRCVKLQTECVYPEPPDRKLLASLRAPPRKRKRRSSGSSPETRWASSVDRSNDSNTHRNMPSEALSGEADINLPSTHVQEILQDLHFTCTVNASLIHHRPTFIRLREENQLPQCLTLATCAMGTIFHPQSSELARQNDNHLKPLGDLKALGRQWALSAGRQVLQGIDRPTTVGAQTCQVLALYWFAVGDTQRCPMFAAIAYRALFNLLRDEEHVSSTTCQSKIAQDRSQWIESETLRRCFWASWIMHCVTSDLYVVGSSIDTRVLDMRLPASDDLFYGTAPKTTITVPSTEILPPTLSEKRRPEKISVASEGMEMTLNWAKVRDHIEARRRLPVSEILAELFVLDQQLLDWASNLPSKFAYSKRNLFEHLVVNQQKGYAVIFAMFHQCRTVLHASLVPHFSGLLHQSAIPLQAVRTSARVALDSATAMSELAADLLALEWDPATLAPFMGYCMYVSASIHVGMIFSKNDHIAMKARSSLLSCLKLLGGMKPYWTKLERLWSRALLLYKAQVNSFSDRNFALTVDSHSELSDLDQIACIPRRTKELAEPLADSVLHYRLENASKKLDADNCSGSLRQLEDAVHRDQIVQLTSEQSRQTQRVTPSRDTGASHLPTPSDFTQTATGFPSQNINDVGSCPSFPEDFLFGDLSDWSDCNIDNLSSTMLSFDELLTGGGIL